MHIWLCYTQKAIGYLLQPCLTGAYMQTKLRYLCSGLTPLFLLLCSHTLFAWSANGHKTVALIAWGLLTQDSSTQAKATVSQVQAILNSLGTGTTLEDIAPCADQIRGDETPAGVCKQFPTMTQSEPWHFITIPITDSPQNASDLAQYCTGSNSCVTDQVKANVQTLQTTTQLSSQQLALMFLVHLVSDMHEPMHCSEEIINGKSNSGGNDNSVSLTLDGTTTKLNLHSLWDYQIQSSDSKNDPATESQSLVASLPSDTSSWISGDYVTTATLESFQYAQTNIYSDYNGTGPDGQACQGSSLGSTYQSVMQPIVSGRLQKAGVRLKALLISAFNPSTQTTSSSQSTSTSTN